MDRRTYLATAGLTLLGGCSGLTESSGAPVASTTDGTSTTGPTQTRSGTGSGTSESDHSRNVVIDLETAPRTYALSPTQYRTPDEGRIEMAFARTATRDHPATLAASLTNENDFANTFRIEWTPPFGRLTSRIPHVFGDEPTDATPDATYREGLVLAPTANHDLVDTPPDVELASDGYWRLASGIDQWLPDTVRLDPGETVHGEYAVVGRHEGVGKGRPVGVYEFRGRADANLRLAVWDTAHPGPDGESRFADVSLPNLPGDAPTAWYHDATASTASYLEPSTESGSLPEQVQFTFVNASRSSVQCGGWNLYKLVDGAWYLIGPWAHAGVCHLLGPGETDTWTLNAYPGEALPDIGTGAGATYGYLGGGRYAVSVGFSASAARSAALVDLTGNPVDIVPTEDVSSSRSGATVTVTSSRHANDRLATLRVTRADHANQTVIPEQVMRARNRGLRNTLAFFRDGVDTVVLETDERTVDRALGPETDTVKIDVHGHGVYRLTRA